MADEWYYAENGESFLRNLLDPLRPVRLLHALLFPLPARFEKAR